MKIIIRMFNIILKKQNRKAYRKLFLVKTKLNLIKYLRKYKILDNNILKKIKKNKIDGVLLN